VLAALHGARQDALAREKAEADAARYRIAQVQQRLDGLRAQLARLADWQAQLAGAPQAYADALVAKEQYLTHSADPRGARLLTLADEHGQLTAELNELRRASDDAGASVQALAEVQDRLGTAANWSTFGHYAPTWPIWADLSPPSPGWRSAQALNSRTSSSTNWTRSGSTC
jgi:chromosome segregation ATPase